MLWPADTAGTRKQGHPCCSRLGKLLFVQALTSVPVKERFTSENGSEELCGTLELVLNGRGSTQESNCTFESLRRDVKALQVHRGMRSPLPAVASQLTVVSSHYRQDLKQEHGTVKCPCM